jgi:uncharacterized protein
LAGVSDSLLKKLTSTIVQLTNPLKIVLFGSYARGTAGPASDLDILIIVEHPLLLEKNRYRLMATLWKSLKDIEISKDILVFSEKEVKDWEQTTNHVIARALREGKVIYERP